MNELKIHPTAVISPLAQIGRDVEVGAYSVIGDGVVIGDGCRIMHHVTVDCNTRIGEETEVFPFCSVGTPPQDITFKGEDTFVEIGCRNKIREFTTLNRGTKKGGGMTRIGDDNYLMAYAHVAHDCQVGNHVIMINGATLAGHVEVEDYAVIGAFSSVHQFVRIGRNSYIGGYTIVLQDVLPFAKIAQNRGNYSLYGPNSIGMMRNGFERSYIDNVKEIYELLFHQDLNTSQSMEKINQMFPDMEESRLIIEFISKTRRGLLKNFENC
jgi:UDP-N-acetylglucosamine acyltransferase